MDRWRDAQRHLCSVNAVTLDLAGFATIHPCSYWRLSVLTTSVLSQRRAHHASDHISDARQTSPVAGTVLQGSRSGREAQLADIARQGARMAHVAHVCAAALLILFSAA